MKKRCWWIKLTVHPLCLIYYTMALLTGYFKWYLISMMIVLIHEYHHAFVARFFHFKIYQIHLYPFGAFLEIEDYGRHPIYQEMLVVLGGLCSHLFIYEGLKLLHYLGMSQISYHYALMMNQYVFYFNLLPIWPLDGSKLLEMILFYGLDYLKAVKLNLYISMFFLLYGMFFYFKINYLMIYVFLWYSLYKAFKESKYRYLSYLLIIEDKKRIPFYHHKLKLYRPYENYLVYHGRVYKEKEMKGLALKTIDKNVYFL